MGKREPAKPVATSRGRKKKEENTNIVQESMVKTDDLDGTFTVGDGDESTTDAGRNLSRRKNSVDSVKSKTSLGSILDTVQSSISQGIKKVAQSVNKEKSSLANEKDHSLPARTKSTRAAKIAVKPDPVTVKASPAPSRRRGAKVAAPVLNASTNKSLPEKSESPNPTLAPVDEKSRPVRSRKRRFENLDLNESRTPDVPPKTIPEKAARRGRKKNEIVAPNADNEISKCQTVDQKKSSTKDVQSKTKMLSNRAAKTTAGATGKENCDVSSISRTRGRKGVLQGLADEVYNTPTDKVEDAVYSTPKPRGEFDSKVKDEQYVTPVPSSNQRPRKLRKK